VTYTIQPVVRVSISERHDGKTIPALLEWQAKAKVFPVPRSGGVSGGGTYAMYFTPEDAVKVEAWLEARKVAAR
jgi:hypothetical protein